jgi:hypothetical protein
LGVHFGHLINDLVSVSVPAGDRFGERVGIARFGGITVVGTEGIFHIFVVLEQASGVSGRTGQIVQYADHDGAGQVMRSSQSLRH